MRSPGVIKALPEITMVLAIALGLIDPVMNLDLSLHHHGIPELRNNLSKAIVEVIRERDGYQREDLTSTTCSHNYFVIFGRIDFHVKEDWRNPCALELYVEIGDQVWRQPVQTPVYAFQVPIQRFLQVIGLFCVQPLNDARCLRSLWRQFFLVQDAGGQQLDIDIATATRGIHQKYINGDTEPIALLPMATISNFQAYRFLSCPAEQDNICPVCEHPGSLPSGPRRRHQSTMDSLAPWWTTAYHERITTERHGQLVVDDVKYVWDFQPPNCDNMLSKWHFDDVAYSRLLVWSFPTVRTWLILLYCVTFIVTRYLISFLGRKENLDCQFPTSLSVRGECGIAKQSSAQSTSNENGPHGSDQSSVWQDKYEASGLWSRDSAGRLTRQLPPENCDDSC